jgi:hypothetical protein
MSHQVGPFGQTSPEHSQQLRIYQRAPSIDFLRHIEAGTTGRTARFSKHWCHAPFAGGKRGFGVTKGRCQRTFDTLRIENRRLWDLSEWKKPSVISGPSTKQGLREVPSGKACCVKVGTRIGGCDKPGSNSSPWSRYLQFLFVADGTTGTFPDSGSLRHFGTMTSDCASGAMLC